MCPSVRRRPESLDLCLIATRNRAGDSTAPEARKEEHRDRGSWREEAIFSDFPGNGPLRCLARTIRYWMMAPLSQSRIAAARHETVLTFVSIAGTDSLLPDAALESNLGIWLRRSKCNQGSNTQKSLLAP